MAADLIYVGATSAPTAGADVSTQTALTLARIDKQLRTQHSSLASAVSMTVYLRHARDFAAMNDEYRQAFTSAPPARTTVVTELLPHGALVEMSAIAAASGTTREMIHPRGWLLSPNPYSYAVRVEPYVLLSGLISRNGRNNSIVEGSVAEQTSTILQNAREILDAAGLSLADICSARVYLTDMRDFEEMNAAYGESFGDLPPVRASGGVRLTADPYDVEISFIASGAPRQRIDAGIASYPHVSSAIVSGDALFVRALLPEPDTCGQPAAETRDVLQQMDRVLAAAGFRRDEVREVLLYVANARASEDAAALCRDVIGSSAALTVIQADIGRPRVSVELAITAIRAQ